MIAIQESEGTDFDGSSQTYLSHRPFGLLGVLRMEKIFNSACGACLINPFHFLATTFRLTFRDQNDAL